MLCCNCSFCIKRTVCAFAGDRMGLVGRSWLYYAFSTAVLMAVSVSAGKFVLTPSDQEPVEGDWLSVPCSSNGGTAILWYKEGLVIPSNSPHFILPSSNFASSSTLTIESANHTLHSGHYACVAVFEDSSQALAPFNITVQYIGLNAGIQLNSDPDCSTGYTLDPGCELQLECLPPTGYPKVKVSWYRNEREFHQSQRVEFADNKRVLTIINATYDDSGGYQCRASNGVGVIRSKLVNITVQGEGRGFRFVGNVSAETVSITEGERLSLNCTVQDAVGRVMFQWQAMRNRETELNITSAANRSSLFINHVTVMDEGLYYCVAMDYQSQITKQYNATVNVPRTLVPQPPFEVHGLVGERVLFHCVASGRPVPQVIWLFQSTSVPVAPAATESGLQDLGNGSLLIPALQMRHAGTYLCMMQPSTLTFHTFTLTVMPRNSLLPQPSVLSTPAGNTVSFTIGPFSHTVSVVLVAVCGIFLLLLSLALLISLCCCCCCCCSQKSSAHSMMKHDTDVQLSSRDCANQSIEEGISQVRETEILELRLPPAPVCHYEVALGASGVTCPRLPSFSSDDSEAATTEVDTTISAATDTQLMK